MIIALLLTILGFFILAFFVVSGMLKDTQEPQPSYLWKYEGDTVVTWKEIDRFPADHDEASGD